MNKPAAFAIKAAIPDPAQARHHFPAHKTMYGGKTIAVGDSVYLFASENEGGRGLVGRGVVIASQPLPRQAGLARQTPRVTLDLEQTERALCSLGRAELAPFADQEGPPEAKLHFKLYRQATNKIVGLSPAAAQFLAALCEPRA